MAALQNTPRKTGRGGANKLNLAGQRFGMLVAESAQRIGKDRVGWQCRCDCGRTKAVATGHLRSGAIQSCVCVKSAKSKARATKHGMCGTKIYQVWIDMMARCHRETCKAFGSYGARGISVCQQWHDVHAFMADMGDPPDGMEIDRIDNNGNYEPGNCRWVTHQVNCNNRRPTIFVEFRGRSATLTEWAMETGINRNTLYGRIFVHGWPLDRAFSSVR